MHSQKQPTRPSLLLLVATLLPLLFACTPPSNPPYTLMPTAEATLTPTPLTAVPTVATATPTPIPQAIVHLNLEAEPLTLDPARTATQPALNVVENLFLGLTTTDPATGEVLPDLARSWTASEGATVWTFYLRDDVYWVRLDPDSGTFERVRHVTAEDVVYGLRRALTPETGSAWAHLLYDIRDAEAIHGTDPTSGTYDLESLGVRALDNYTVQFEMERPAAYFPVIAGMWVARPQPREAIEEHGDDWAQVGKIWTNGAYALQSWDHDSRILLVKNPYHYRADDVQIELVDFAIIPDDAAAMSAAIAAYDNGDLDSIALPGAGRELACWPQCEILDPLLFQDLVITALPCTYYYGFNTAKAPFDDVHVRRAFSQAIDRQHLIKEVLQDVHWPAHSFAGPAVWGTAAYDGDVGVFYDPAAARDELVEAGYPGGEDFPPVTLMYNTSEWNQRTAEAIRQMWLETLGVEVQLDHVDWAHYQAAISVETPAEDAPHIWRMGWCAYYPDQHNWVHQNFNLSEGSNLPRLRTDDAQVGSLVQEFDELTRSAAAERDPVARIRQYRRAEHLLNYEIAAIAPIYHYTQVYATKPYLQRDYATFGGTRIERWNLFKK